MSEELNIIPRKVGFLFDLDGVLIDSETEYTRIWAHINDQFPSGYPDLPMRIKGMTLEKIIETYYPDPEHGPKLTKLLLDLENEMRYEWKPGARELLEKLSTRGYDTVLVTSSNDRKMAHFDDELPEARGYFTRIITGDMVSHSKPDPEGYLLAARLIDTDPRRCVVFEDSLQGVKAGKAAGALVIGVAGTLPAETIAPYSDIVVDSLENINIADIVNTLKNR